MSRLPEDPFAAARPYVVGRIELSGHPLAHPDGTPVRAADLVEGGLYRVSPEGIVSRAEGETEADFAPRPGEDVPRPIRRPIGFVDLERLVEIAKVAQHLGSYGVESDVESSFRVHLADVLDDMFGRFGLRFRRGAV